MSQADKKPPRSWRELARLTAYEQDPHKFLKLAQKLIRTLDAESDRRMAMADNATRTGKVTSAGNPATQNQEHSCR